VDVPSNYNSNRFCGKSVRKDQPPVSDSSSSKHPTPVSDSSSSKHPTPVSDSSSSKHPKTANSSDICNCDKSSDSSSSKHPEPTRSSDICNCDKSEDYFAENKSWIIPLIVTAVIDTVGVAAAVVSVVYKIFCNKPNDDNGVSL